MDISIDKLNDFVNNMARKAQEGEDAGYIKAVSEILFFINRELDEYCKDVARHLDK